MRSASFGSPELISYIQRSLHRETLIKAAVYSSLTWFRDARHFEFALNDKLNRDRFERFTESLTIFSSNPNYYSQVMQHVEKEDWISAESLCSQLLSLDINRAGVTLDKPPALADALILALLPNRQTDFLAKAIVTE
jgi:hypothetical protein